MTCTEHAINPAIGYESCAGCEIERLNARIAKIVGLLRKVRDRAVNMDPFTLNEVNEAIKG